MTSQTLDSRLAHAPWPAIAGELITAVCFGCMALFLPLSNWVWWPELLFGWHFALIVIGTLGVAIALARRRPGALKVAIVLAAYIGLPSLLSLSQAVGEIRSAAHTLSYAVWGIGMFGQVIVVFSSLRRLTPGDRAAYDYREKFEHAMSKVPKTQPEDRDRLEA